MTKQTADELLYESTVAIHPGEMLEEYLECYEMKPADLAAHLDISEKEMDDILNGEAPITAKVACGLSRVFIRPVHFWHNLQHGYEEAVKVINQKDRPGASLHRLKTYARGRPLSKPWLSEQEYSELPASYKEEFSVTA